MDTLRDWHNRVAVYGTGTMGTGNGRATSHVNVQDPSECRGWMQVGKRSSGSRIVTLNHGWPFRDSAVGLATVARCGVSPTASTAVNVDCSKACCHRSSHNLEYLDSHVRSCGDRPHDVQHLGTCIEVNATCVLCART